MERLAVDGALATATLATASAASAPELRTATQAAALARQGPSGGGSMRPSAEAGPPQQAAHAVHAAGRNGRVAVVLDKDRFFREFQALLLGQQGFQVHAPEEPGAFTIDYLAQANPHLVVTEILLPGADGLELVQAVKRHPTLRKARVIVFSVLNAESRALACGADRFVQKPLMRDSFLRVIEEVTQGANGDLKESPA